MRPPESSNHDLSTVRRVLRVLAGAGLECWLFGGWAEELRGMCKPRAHRDIDILCVANNFDQLAELLRTSSLVEIHAKRFHHKRAFLFETVMVEAFLAETDSTGRFTMFWGHARHGWPPDTFSHLSGMPVVSRTALESYRRNHASVAPLRAPRPD